jgi:RNA polymerase sigma-70 factor (ECF subfamily)
MTDGPPDPLDAGELYRLHAAYVARFLWRLGVRGAEVDDLVQEVFVVAHRRGGFVPDRAKPTTWLAEIAVRVASANRRRNRRSKDELELDDAPALQTDEPDAREKAETKQRLQRVQRALDALDEAQRAVFVLFELEGESCEEIAAGLGIPIGTVHSRLHTARKNFMRMHSRQAVLDDAQRRSA